jgi:hypothetical protein
MRHDLIYTLDATRALAEATSGPSPGQRLALSLAQVITSLPSLAPGFINVCNLPRHPGNQPVIEEVAELAWRTASPRPVDVGDLWHALLCLDIGVRLALESVLGAQPAQALHRQAIRAVLGDGVVRILEKRLGRPS